MATAEERTAQREERWADAQIDGRTHWSVRETYQRHAVPLRRAVQQYFGTVALAAGLRQEGSSIAALPPVLLEVIVSFAFRGLRPLVRHLFAREQRTIPRPGASFRVTVRKRPMLPFESAAGETDTVTVQAVPRVVVCHDGRLVRSGRRLSMAHREYAFDWVWDAKAGNAEVAKEVEPLLAAACQGGAATLICYGQTGTGKTHTVAGAMDHLAAALAGRDVAITFFEIHGRECRDLLQDRAPVHLRADATETVHVRGARRVTLPKATPQEILGVLRAALALRASEATERNPISSRSHAVCDIEVLAAEGTSGTPGRLRCVDLAGSERNYETVEMTPRQHRESADINTALMALKHCFRAHAKLQDLQNEAEGHGPAPPVHIPFRNSVLTRVLRGCFTEAGHRTVLIATVSPTATDLHHTINTLDHVSLMAASLASAATTTVCEVPLADPAADLGDRPVWEWTNDEVIAWIASAEGGRFSRLALPTRIDGQGLLSLNARRLGELFEGPMRQARLQHEGEAWAIGVDDEGDGPEADLTGTDRLGHALFDALRREQERVLERRLRT